MLFFELSIHKSIMDFFYHGLCKNIKKHNCFQRYNNINASWAANQHIIIISEGWCNTEDWSNDAEISDLQSQE